MSPCLPNVLPPYVVPTMGGAPLVLELVLKALRRQFGSDLLAGMSIITVVVLGEYLGGALGADAVRGRALERFAAGRSPSHRKLFTCSSLLRPCSQRFGSTQRTGDRTQNTLAPARARFAPCWSPKRSLAPFPLASWVTTHALLEGRAIRLAAYLPDLAVTDGFEQLPRTELVDHSSVANSTASKLREGHMGETPRF